MSRKRDKDDEIDNLYAFATLHVDESVVAAIPGLTWRGGFYIQLKLSSVTSQNIRSIAFSFYFGLHEASLKSTAQTLSIDLDPLSHGMNFSLIELPIPAQHGLYSCQG